MEEGEEAGQDYSVVRVRVGLGAVTAEASMQTGEI